MNLFQIFKTLLSPPPPGVGRDELVFQAGMEETPLVNAYLKAVFEDPECETLILAVLSKPVEDRNDLEHVFFTTFLMGQLEHALRGDLVEVQEALRRSVAAEAEAKRARKKKGRRRGET